MADRRADLTGADRAVSDALDVNYRMHGMTASWAYPVEFRTELQERGYDVVAAMPEGLPATLATVDDVRAVCEAAEMAQTSPGRWGTWYAAPVQLVPTYGVEGVAAVYAHKQKLAAISHDSPSRLLWAAIEAARGGETP